MGNRRTVAADWLAGLVLLSAACDGSESGSMQGDDPTHSTSDGGAGQGARDGATALGNMDGGAGTDPARSGPARIATRVTVPSQISKFQRFELRAGAARGAGLASLKYFIRSIQICESMETQGTGFSNPMGCLSLYTGDESAYPYQLTDDFTALATQARTSDVGFVDLLDATSRNALSGDTVLTGEHVRSYNFGIITWALPIKVTATLSFADGFSLYTHGGESRSEIIGADHYRMYYTAPSISLSQAPADETVVVLPNGGNWFKFQSPLTITQADIDQGTAFDLDLVFNPDGIVKGFTGPAGGGNILERNDAGTTLAGISVPMLDLAPVPHRASEQVVRESYQGAMTVAGQAFDMRIELYYVEGDSDGVIYGVDVKSLVNNTSHDLPPEVSKVSFLERQTDGSYSLLSWKHSPVITGLQRVMGDTGTTRVSVACATHADRAGAEGGAAIVLNSCPSARIDVDLSLMTRSRVEGGFHVASGAGLDAAVGNAGGVDGGAGAEAGPGDAATSSDGSAVEAGARDASAADASAADAGVGAADASAADASTADAG